MGQENVAFQHHVTWSRLTSCRGTTYDSVKKNFKTTLYVRIIFHLM